MLTLQVTRHAQARMAQRGLSSDDLDLLLQLGVEVPQGYLATRKGVAEISCQLKRIIDRLERLPGKRVVVRNDVLVTTYHATERQQRRLLAHGPKRDSSP